MGLQCGASLIDTPVIRLGTNTILRWVAIDAKYLPEPGYCVGIMSYSSRPPRIDLQVGSVGHLEKI